MSFNESIQGKPQLRSAGGRMAKTLAAGLLAAAFAMAEAGPKADTVKTTSDTTVIINTQKGGSGTQVSGKTAVKPKKKAVRTAKAKPKRIAPDTQNAIDRSMKADTLSGSAAGFSGSGISAGSGSSLSSGSGSSSSSTGLSERAAPAGSGISQGSASSSAAVPSGRRDERKPGVVMSAGSGAATISRMPESSAAPGGSPSVSSNGSASVFDTLGAGTVRGGSERNLWPGRDTASSGPRRPEDRPQSGRETEDIGPGNMRYRDPFDWRDPGPSRDPLHGR